MDEFFNAYRLLKYNYKMHVLGRYNLVISRELINYYIPNKIFYYMERKKYKEYLDELDNTHILNLLLFLKRSKEDNNYNLNTPREIIKNKILEVNMNNMKSKFEIDFDFLELKKHDIFGALNILNLFNYNKIGIDTFFNYINENNLYNNLLEIMNHFNNTGFCLHVTS